jgi:hypothetical protein
MMTCHDISRRAKFRISTTSAESLGVLVGAAQERRLDGIGVWACHSRTQVDAKC